MKLEEALSIINYDKMATKEQELEAFATIFKEMYGVDIQNPDGTYKDLFNLFEEANKNLNKTRVWLGDKIWSL